MPNRPDRRTTPEVVALILNLRRSAEKDAQRRAHAARAELEAARARVLVLAGRLAAAERAVQAIAGASGDARGDSPGVGVGPGGGPAPVPAAALRERQELLRRRREALALARTESAEGGRRLALLVRQAEALRELWMQSIARREAAERHEENERRERTRYRARRAAAVEDELSRQKR